MPDSPAQRTGRRRGGQGRGDSGTREAILHSARRLFAERGYADSSIRAIAADAGVTPPLVIHFFGSKAQLLIAAVDWPFDPQRVLPQLIAEDRGDVGRALVRLFVGTWEEAEQRNTLLSLLESAMADPHAAALLREFLVHQLFGPLTEAIGAPDGAIRSNLIAAQLVGVAMLRHVLDVSPLNELRGDDLVALLAPPIQRLLTDPLPAPSDAADVA